MNSGCSAKNLKCYICNSVPTRADSFEHLFDPRINSDGELDATLSDILSDVLGKNLDESEVHTPLVCIDCRDSLVMYDTLQQEFKSLRMRIISTYNIAKKHYEQQNEPRFEDDDLVYEVFEDNNVSDMIEVEVFGTGSTDEETISSNVISKGQIKGETNCDEVNKMFSSTHDNRPANNEEVLYYEVIDSTAKTSTTEIQYEFQFECTKCQKVFADQQLLNEHYNERHNDVSAYKCPKCRKEFTCKNSLSAHMRTHTDRARPYVCNQCDKSFYKQQTLRQHLQIHDGVKAFVCDVCQKAFQTQHNLNLHKLIHNEKRPFICAYCGKGFVRRPELRDHERTHTGERPFKCDLCDAAFAQRSNLMTHKKSTHLNVRCHKCDECGKSFKRRRLLEYHIKGTHTGERPISCELCDATFINPTHYKKHKLIHAGVKPYACEVCGKTFSSRENRNAHRYIHSNKKPYECVECGEGFMRKQQLYMHMKTSEHYSDQIIVNQPQIGTGELEKVPSETNPKILEQIIRTEETELN